MKAVLEIYLVDKESLTDPEAAALYSRLEDDESMQMIQRSFSEALRKMEDSGLIDMTVDSFKLYLPGRFLLFSTLVKQYYAVWVSFFCAVFLFSVCLIVCIVNIDGFQSEWCISNMICSRATPFWSETLDMQVNKLFGVAQIFCSYE